MRDTYYRLKQATAKRFPIVFTSFLVLPIIALFAIAHAADVPVVSESDTFGAADGEFSMNGLKGLYRWNVERKWTGGINAIREDNTFGIAKGDFTARTVSVNSNSLQIAFDNGVAIKGKSDDKGRITYLPNQKASFGAVIGNHAIQFVLVNGAYHVVSEDGKGTLETRNGYLTCTDGTQVSMGSVWIDEIVESVQRMSTKVKSEKYNGMWIPQPLYNPLTLYKPGTWGLASLKGIYKDGRIILNPGQTAIIRSTQKLLLEDGTILLPNDDGIYKIEVRDGLPVLVDVQIYQRKGNEELFE